MHDLYDAKGRPKRIERREGDKIIVEHYDYFDDVPLIPPLDYFTFEATLEILGEGKPLPYPLEDE